MTKSMNPQTREEVANEWCNHNQFEASASLFTAFLAGTEWKNKQLLDVVNELRDALEHYEDIPYIKVDGVDSQGYEIENEYYVAADTIAKVDAMMKDMGINND